MENSNSSNNASDILFSLLLTKNKVQRHSAEKGYPTERGYSFSIKMNIKGKGVPLFKKKVPFVATVLLWD